LENGDAYKPSIGDIIFTAASSIRLLFLWLVVCKGRRAIVRKLIFVLALVTLTAGCGQSIQGAVHIQQGNDYSDKGNYDQAIAAYDKAIQRNPDYAEAYYGRGNAYEAKGDHDRAIADYDKAIQLNPDYAEAYYNRGNA